MNSWYLFSLLALVLLGAQRFLYKVAAERNCPSGLTTAVFMGTVTVLSGAVFVISGARPGDLSTLLVLSLINSASFALATVAHMEALKYLPATLTFPLTRLSLVVVILFSVGYFGERLGALQWLGVLAGLGVPLVLTRDAGRAPRQEGVGKAGFGYVSLAVAAGAVAAISSKFAAVSASKSGFMALSYLLGTVFALLVDRRWKGERAGGRSMEAVKIGLLMGLLNFAGFYAFLTALGSGPLSVIALITGMHFVIAVLLSVLLYRERITPRRLLGIGLTLVAVILLHLEP